MESFRKRSLIRKPLRSRAFLLHVRGIEQRARARAGATSASWQIFLVSTLAIACAGLVALPRTRQTLATVYRSTAHAGRNLLNPQPAQVPQTVTQHDSFGQEGDEYKFPVVANIPDATTDPSQIRVLPVIDPTAKPEKGSEAASATTAAEENVSPNGSQGGSISGTDQSTMVSRS